MALLGTVKHIGKAKRDEPLKGVTLKIDNEVIRGEQLRESFTLREKSSQRRVPGGYLWEA